MAALAQAQLAFDNPDLPALVLLGRDDSNKAHAAWFDQTEVDAAAGAAVLMGMILGTCSVDGAATEDLVCSFFASFRLPPW